MPRFPGRGQGGNGGDGDGPFGGMVPMGGMFGGMPIIIREGQYPQQQQQSGHADTPPVRALLALRYLQWLKDTQEKRPMPTAVSEGRQEFEIVPGQEPTEEERATGVAAANVLEHYFIGDLKPNVWEGSDLSPAPIAEMNCRCVPVDANGRPLSPPAENCPFCSGSGKMKVVFDGPTTGQLLVQASDPKDRPRHPELDAPAPPAAPPAGPARRGRPPQS